MKILAKGKVIHVKELYTSPEFTVVRFATEDTITASYESDNGVDIEDLYPNS